MHELNFHPDFLAAQTRPSPPGSFLMPVSIIITTLAMITLSIFSSIDVIVSANGRLIPNGKVKILRATQPGLVSKLTVQDGQLVAAGDLLVELDDRGLRAQLQSITAQIDSVVSRLVLYQKISELTLPELNSSAVDIMLDWLPDSLAIQALHREWLGLRLTNLQDKLHAIARDRIELLAERQYAETLALHAADIELLVQSSYEARKSLAKQNYLARLGTSEYEITWQQARYATIEYRQRKNLLDVRINSLEASVGEIFRGFLLEVAEQRQLLDLQRRTLLGRQSGISAQLFSSKIVSPIKGIVENLSIASEGVYVNSGDALLSIVPIGLPAVAEVMISSREVGFIRVGQQARIKVDAFSFTRYGSLPGELVYLSSDAVIDNAKAESLFVGHILLGKEFFNSHKGKQTVQTGMSVQADVITDERSLLDFFIAPVKQAILEAMHER